MATSKSSSGCILYFVISDINIFTHILTGSHNFYHFGTCIFVMSLVRHFLLSQFFLANLNPQGYILGSTSLPFYVVSDSSSCSYSCFPPQNMDAQLHYNAWRRVPQFLNFPWKYYGHFSFLFFFISINSLYKMMGFIMTLSHSCHVLCSSSMHFPLFPPLLLVSFAFQSSSLLGFIMCVCLYVHACMHERENIYIQFSFKCFNFTLYGSKLHCVYVPHFFIYWWASRLIP